MEVPMKNLMIIAIVFAVSGFNIQAAVAGTGGDQIFKKKCAMCHAINKKKFGPAFSNMSKDPATLKSTIRNGRKMMPSFSKKLSADEIDAMVSLIQSSQVQ